MRRTKEQKQEYINLIFSERLLFEWEVLHVFSQDDRLEVMHILAKTIVRDRLKYEINFLFIQNYEDFKFSQIVNILFHEIANEWLVYATEVLKYPKNIAIEELKDKKRVRFIHSLANTYYKKYKEHIFEEIADTFLELVVDIEEETKLIKDVLQGDLMKSKHILSIDGFSGLWNMINTAQNRKNSDRLSVKMKISEIKEKYENEKVDLNKRQRLFELLEKSNLDLQKLEHSGLDKFNVSVSRLKDAMVNSMSEL